MSLPVPSTSPSSTFSMDPKRLQAMEAPLIALANSAGGDLRMLLYAFFGFLNRRTDFYLVPNALDLKEGKAKMGFPEGDAEKLLLAAFRQFPLRRIPRQQAGAQQTQQQGAAAPTKSSTTTTTGKAKSAPNTPAIEDSGSKDSATTTSKEATATPPSTSPEKSNSEKDATNTTTNKDSIESSNKKAIDSDEKIRHTEEGLQVPIGNGGSTKRYKWTQTIDECTVMIGLPEGTRAKDLDVSLKASSIHVKAKPTPSQQDQPSKDDNDNGVTTAFVEGPLVEKIVPDESTWSLEGGVMIIILYKAKKTFWDTVIEGDEKIDTSLVDSRRHISEYDEATQGQLRKIMFDQKQQEKGLPTSDEMTGTKTIPPMPPGVEYIDKSTFEKDDQKKEGGK